MTDKEKIRAEIFWRYDKLKLCNSSEAKSRREAYKELQEFIDSLPEEPVSEDLYKFATQSANKLYPPEYEMADDNWKQRAGYVKGCEDGANWKEEQIMKEAITIPFSTSLPNEIYNPLWINGAEIGDKIKLIIIKEEQK